MPPVTPPSGRFIAQLFLVPGMIVLVAVLLLLAFRYLLGGGHTPESFLRQLDSDNADIRWRGASDLAQVLKRPESMHLRSDVRFAMELAHRLRSALDELDAEERHIQEKAAKSSTADREKLWRTSTTLRNLRNHVSFLAAALGDFVAPSGLPLLSEIILRDDSPDVKGNLLRRRQALWALSNLGENIKGFKKLSKDKQAEVFDTLTLESEGPDPLRAVCAYNAIHYLDASRLPARWVEGLVEVDKLLAKVAESEDRYLREQVALAFNFWDGPLAEPTLQKLARDRGHGTLIRITEQD